MKELWQLFTAFFKLGAFTFGGGMAMLPIIQREAVEVRGWLTEEEMVDCIAVAQSMPGVIAINTATYIGNRRKGAVGAFAATFGVILPSLLIIIAAVLLLNGIGENRYVSGAFTGIKAASCAMILAAAIKLGRQVVRSPLAWVLAVGSFLAIAVFDVTAIWAIIAGAVIGCIYVSMGKGGRE